MLINNLHKSFSIGRDEKCMVGWWTKKKPCLARVNMIRNSSKIRRSRPKVERQWHIMTWGMMGALIISRSTMRWAHQSSRSFLYLSGYFLSPSSKADLSSVVDKLNHANGPIRRFSNDFILPLLRQWHTLQAQKPVVSDKCHCGI